ILIVHRGSPSDRADHTTGGSTSGSQVTRTKGRARDRRCYFSLPVPETCIRNLSGSPCAPPATSQGEATCRRHEAAQTQESERQLMKEQQTNNRALIRGPSWSASDPER